MVETKKFEELSISKSIVLKNKHIAILLKHKIESLNKFVQYKIEELEPIKKIQNDIDKELDTDINMTPKSLDTLNSQIDQRNE